MQNKRSPLEKWNNRPPRRVYLIKNYHVQWEENWLITRARNILAAPVCEYAAVYPAITGKSRMNFLFFVRTAVCIRAWAFMKLCSPIGCIRLVLFAICYVNIMRFRQASFTCIQTHVLLSIMDPTKTLFVTITARILFLYEEAKCSP